MDEDYKIYQSAGKGQAKQGAGASSWESYDLSTLYKMSWNGKVVRIIISRPGADREAGLVFFIS